MHNRSIYFSFVENSLIKLFSNQNQKNLKNYSRFLSENYNFYNSTNLNQDDPCAVKINQILKIILNNNFSSYNIEEYKGFFLYSGLGLLDYGDYPNCIK